MVEPVVLYSPSWITRHVGGKPRIEWHSWVKHLPGGRLLMWYDETKLLEAEGLVTSDVSVGYTCDGSGHRSVLVWRPLRRDLGP